MKASNSNCKTGIWKTGIIQSDSNIFIVGMGHSLSCMDTIHFVTNDYKNAFRAARKLVRMHNLDNAKYRHPGHYAFDKLVKHKNYDTEPFSGEKILYCWHGQFTYVTIVSFKTDKEYFSLWL